MADIKSIVQIILWYCHNNGFLITPLKLQKLLYFIQSWYIVNFNKDLLFEELPEAWVNGPVYRSIYDDFKKSFFKNDRINSNIKDEKKMAEKLKQVLSDAKLTHNQEELIIDVLKVYAPMSEEELIFLTHSALPWNNARKGYKPLDRCTNKLSVEDMYNYYSKK